MKQWLRGGANNTPHHASGTRATDRALSHTRSLTAATVAVAMMATVAVTALLPTYNAKADVTSGTAGICTPKTLQLGGLDATSSPDDSVATYVGGTCTSVPTIRTAAVAAAMVAVVAACMTLKVRRRQ